LTPGLPNDTAYQSVYLPTKYTAHDGHYKHTHTHSEFDQMVNSYYINLFPCKNDLNVYNIMDVQRVNVLYLYDKDLEQDLLLLIAHKKVIGII